MTDATLIPQGPGGARESDRRYVGMVDWWGAHVWIEEGGVRRALPYRGDVPLAGFAWGRAGLAARELARSLIEDATGSPALAERHCRDMTHGVIARLSRLGFELDRDDVVAWVEQAATLRRDPAAAA
jgi:hypothetical protein